MFCYYNNGLSMRAVDPDYTPQSGELLFSALQDPIQLAAAFADYTSAMAAANPSNAQVALDKSDITVLRCYSAGVAVPSAWQTYRAALRAIVNGQNTSGNPLPSIPSYPPGT